MVHVPFVIVQANGSIQNDEFCFQMMTLALKSFRLMEKERPDIAEKIMAHVMDKMSEKIRQLTHENHLLLRDNREEVRLTIDK